MVLEQSTLNGEEFYILIVGEWIDLLKLIIDVFIGIHYTES